MTDRAALLRMRDGEREKLLDAASFELAVATRWWLEASPGRYCYFAGYESNQTYARPIFVEREGWDPTVPGNELQWSLGCYTESET